MTSFVAYEPVLRLGAFVTGFIVLALWEVVAPRRSPGLPRAARWPGNLALLAVDAIVLRVLVPGAAIAVAIAGEAGGWGLLNALDVPPWLAVVLAVILLDLALYFQHVMFHAVPTLWRLHRVHHSDLEVDVTTGTRFHPIEIVLSTAIKCAVVAAIGAPAMAVLAFEVLLNATSMFNHANVKMPMWLYGAMRWLIVRPDMHRIHHSVEYDESSSNFGFNLPWWDHLFATYRASARVAQEQMVVGVDAFRSVDHLRLDRLLIQPFLDTPGRYPINRRQQVHLSQSRTTLEILNDHLACMERGDLEGDLAANYVTDCVLLTSYGSFDGHDGRRVAARRATTEREVQLRAARRARRHRISGMDGGRRRSDGARWCGHFRHT